MGFRYLGPARQAATVPEQWRLQPINIDLDQTVDHRTSGPGKEKNGVKAGARGVMGGTKKARAEAVGRDSDRLVWQESGIDCGRYLDN